MCPPPFKKYHPAKKIIFSQFQFRQNKKKIDLQIIFKNWPPLKKQIPQLRAVFLRLAPVLWPPSDLIFFGQAMTGGVRSLWISEQPPRRTHITVCLLKLE